MMFRKVLVANRGAIACRIFRTLDRMGIRSVAVYSEADRHSMHVAQAREAVPIGPAQASQSYLSFERIFQAAAETGAEAIHPGYGFLSENADFAEACTERGIVFIGPRPAQIRAFGLKHTAREIASGCGAPMLPGTGLLANVSDAFWEAERIGYPVMLKSTAGGGGIGMRLCHTPQDLAEGFEAVQRLSAANFKNSGIYLEKFVEKARHIEVQIFGDGKGEVIALGERDCSAQRRNQKVIEETPAPRITESTRAALLETAVRLGKAVGYESAGTVEFIYDGETERFYFLEVNTRLQVEHGVTEEVTGVDLVGWMLRQAAGELPPLQMLQQKPKGCSIQARIYAEDPARGFQPSAGRLIQAKFPTDARVDTWVEAGTDVTPFYDPLLAKIIVYGQDRREAVEYLQKALQATRFDGIETNLHYLRDVCRDPVFVHGGVNTAYLKSFRYHDETIEVLDAGTQTTVQDYPGRKGYWDVGVPPSGPMDSLSFRLANRLVKNDSSAAALEITMTGPSLRFHFDTVIALTGANMDARIDGKRAPRWKAIAVKAGSVLKMGTVQNGGCRAYLAVHGGFDVPDYLCSKSTFLLGRFGGHAGRAVRAGDLLRVHDAAPMENLPELVEWARPTYGAEWEVGVLYGPHGAPDFFTQRDIEMFFSTAWKIHYNSDRTGVRLLGPKPQWARTDGGEAGLHPSNLHDNAYAVGTVDFTGDMPVILGPDGPSLGGFVCPATVVAAELWKLGQLHPSDRIRFRRLTMEEAAQMEADLEKMIETLTTPLPLLPAHHRIEPAIIREKPETSRAPKIVVRADGDKNLLLEYGPNLLDLNLRFRVHALVEQLQRMDAHGIIDITPGIRSLQVHYDSRVLPRAGLLEMLDEAESRIPDLDNIEVASRIVHLPLSWDDPATQLAIRKYVQSVRPDAPWAPSNIEFIRRINGLSSIDEVHRIVYGASYLVLGLGDVYLGAPVATPLDPRHRLVTTKYNPARTWTPENAVGIGGAYLCVYGMEGPGGYQFVGRTLQMWNTFHETKEFVKGSPWLLRFFDQIRFYPVSAEELLEIREDFPRGKFPLRIEQQQFSLREYHAFLNSISSEAAEFKQHQQAAFIEERQRWAAAGQAEIVQAPEELPTHDGEDAVPRGCEAVRSPITASVWNVAVEPGQRVEAGQKLIVLEAMKMEVAVSAPTAGKVEELRCREGAFVTAGQSLIVFRPEQEAA